MALGVLGEPAVKRAHSLVSAATRFAHVIVLTNQLGAQDPKQSKELVERETAQVSTIILFIDNTIRIRAECSEMS